nr:ABC transporter ATP-binding protein [Vibrio intestinalis]
MTAVRIEIKHAALRYLDSEQPVLQGLNMHIQAGKWTCLLGRSGCGKTTLLRYLAGLAEQQVEWHGELSVSPKSLGTASPLQGQLAYMAQQDLLLPWLSVLDNVCLNQRFSSVSESDKQRALTLLEKVGLANDTDKLPQQLSGGMRQRVALARTLMQDKPLVLMDEPFSALDAVTRYKLQSLAAELLRDKTVILITHDPQEAIRLADQLYVLRGSPASACQLPVPSTLPPRNIDAECAQLQQQILDTLEHDYE